MGSERLLMKPRTGEPLTEDTKCILCHGKWHIKHKLSRGQLNELIDLGCDCKSTVIRVLYSRSSWSFSDVKTTIMRVIFIDKEKMNMNGHKILEQQGVVTFCLNCGLQGSFFSQVKCPYVKKIPLNVHFDFTKEEWERIRLWLDDTATNYDESIYKSFCNTIINQIDKEIINKCQ